jgi:hypothetical protein
MALRLAFSVAFLVACGPAVAPAAPANTASAAPAIAPVAAGSVEDVAMRLGRAALAGDRRAALALTLTYAELKRISRKAGERDKASWDAEVADFFDHLAREGAEAGATMKVVGAKVRKTGKVVASQDSKVLRDVEFAVAQLVIEQDGGEARPQGVPLFFLKTEAGWRFSPSQ